MNKNLVTQQFGANAAAYIDSHTHAHGQSLNRLVELVRPQSDWRVLDMATAAGHTAFAFAPFVATVIGLDLTRPMLEQARRLGQETDNAHIPFICGDIDDLPFADGTFAAVTCRIAAHHFPDIDRFLSEARRVLRPGGVLGIVDNIVPGSRLRGKKASQQRQAGDYINAFEKLRDPSHVRCLSAEAWVDQLAAAGFVLDMRETIDKRLVFESWAARHSPNMQIRLKAMLLKAPAIPLEFLDPQTESGLTTFRLREGLFIAHCP